MKDADVTGGIAVSRILAGHGIGTVFALGGASHAHLLTALADDGFRIVSGRHETGTVGAADGYARVTGKVGVALIITDQGLPNAVTGIATAFHACSPVLVLVAGLPASWLEAEAEYDTDALALVRPIAKWVRTVPAAERLGEYVATGLKRAAAGRPGPVVLQIPQDHLAALVPAPGVLTRPHAIARPAPDPAAVARAVELIATAQRPLVICGSGAARGRGSAAALARLAGTGLPVAGNGLGRGLLPEDRERSFAWPLAQIAAREADVVLVAGARLKQRLGFGLPPRFAPDARFIQIDLEATEPGRNRRIEVPIVADCGLALAAIANGLEQHSHKHPSRGPWLATALAQRFRYLDGVGTRSVDPIHPLALGYALERRMPPDAILVGDGADVQNWMYGALRVRRAPGFLDHYPLGSMGIGLPLAVGAAAGAAETGAGHGVPARPVVLVTGDGSFGFYSAELDAVRSAGLPLVVVIANDAAWGTEYHGQQLALGRSVNTLLQPCDYRLVAEAFGCEGMRVERSPELGPALDRAFAASRPTVIDVRVDREAGMALKREPLAKMILFDDLASNLRDQHAFASGRE
jgi:thiamine pyrophosphate-dependent acetolactate synthase large subunit-like protein